MLKTIYLEGYLGEKFGKEHTFDIKDMKEGIRALCTQINGFTQEFRGTHVKIIGDGYAFKADLQLDLPYKEYVIIPVPAGSKDAFFQVFIGAVLIAAAFYTGGTSMAAWGAWQTGAFMMGASLIIGAFSQVSMQDYSQKEDPDNRPSYLWNGAVNTIEQGGPVPIICGRVKTGGCVISVEMDVEDVKV